MDLVQRAKNICLTPNSEWGVIETEPSTIADIYKGYAVPLALIPAVCGLIGGGIFGPAPFHWALVAAIIQFIAGMVGIYVFALIIDALAPTFNGAKNPLAAFKVATYSATPAWLAGVFALIPGLRFLGILGLYSIYVFYLGLPRLMRAPEDKAVGYTAVAIVAAIVLWVVLGILLTMFVGGAYMM